MFYERFENTVGKGEIARHEQFFLFLQCFQKACFQEASKGVIVWERVKDKLFPQRFQKACFQGASKGVIVWERVKDKHLYLGQIRVMSSFPYQTCRVP